MSYLDAKNIAKISRTQREPWLNMLQRIYIRHFPNFASVRIPIFAKLGQLFIHPLHEIHPQACFVFETYSRIAESVAETLDQETLNPNSHFVDTGLLHQPKFQDSNCIKLIIRVFPKIGVEKSQNEWFISWKTLLKWMIWGYHYFWKHPYILFYVSQITKLP